MFLLILKKDVIGSNFDVFNINPYLVTYQWEVYLLENNDTEHCCLKHPWEKWRSLTPGEI